MCELPSGRELIETENLLAMTYFRYLRTLRKPNGAPRSYPQKRIHIRCGPSIGIDWITDQLTTFRPVQNVRVVHINAVLQIERRKIDEWPSTSKEFTGWTDNTRWNPFSFTLLQLLRCPLKRLMVVLVDHQSFQDMPIGSEGILQSLR